MNLPIYKMLIADNIEDDEEVSFISLVEFPAIKKNFLAFNEQREIKFSVKDEEQQIVTGALMIADMPIYRRDKDEEYYVVFTAEEIKKIAQRFFKKGYQAKVNLEHSIPVDGVYMYESYIIDREKGVVPPKGFEDVSDGSWFGTFKIENDEIWTMVKEGTFKGFSVEGLFKFKKTEETIEETKDEKMMGQIIKILEQVYWDESDVERDEDGRFAPKGGGSDGGSDNSGSGSEGKTKAPSEKKNHQPEINTERPKWARQNKKYESSAKETVDKILKNSNQKEGTNKIYSDKDGKFNSERESFHHTIEKDYIKGKRYKNYKDKGTSYFMGGAPATGKSSIEQHGLISHPKGILKVDPDEIKGSFPEYREMLKRREKASSSLIHEESSKVSKDIVKSAAKKKWDVVVDTVGDGSYKSVAEKVKQQRDAGKKVVAHYVTTDTNTSIKRAKERAEESGRYVPEKYNKKMHRRVSALVPKFAKNNLFDELHLYDNNGKKPKLIFSHTKGKSTIYDKSAYSKFLAKAKEG